MTDTDDLRTAREWLIGAYNDQYEEDDNVRHTFTIRRRLDQPVCPKGSEVPDDVVQAMIDCWYAGPCDSVGMRDVIDTLRAHLTAPPVPKKVEAWAVKLDDGDTELFRCNGVATARRLQLGLGEDRVVRLVEAADADA